MRAVEQKFQQILPSQLSVWAPFLVEQNTVAKHKQQILLQFSDRSVRRHSFLLDGAKIHRFCDDRAVRVRKVGDCLQHGDGKNFVRVKLALVKKEGRRGTQIL